MSHASTPKTKGKFSWIHFIAFGCMGITGEIFFTALRIQFAVWQEGDPINWALQGKSYIWMFPIYGIAAFLFSGFFHHIEHWKLIFRLLLYVLLIYCIEFTTGALLELTIGKCPWEYTTGWHIMGYIRLDYFPAWLGFGFLLEKMYMFLRRVELG